MWLHRNSVVWLLAVCCLALAVELTKSQDTFYFNPQPEDKSVIKGHNVTIQCNVSNDHQVTFYWTLDGQRLENNTRRYMRGSDLYISRVDPQHDLGEFKCVARNVTTGHAIVSRAAQVNILWITDTVRVVAPEPSWNAAVGGKLVLRCKADGNPEIKTEWFHNGDQVFHRNRISVKGNQLHITDLKITDNGIYSCRAGNDVGFVESSEIFALKVLDDESPHIIVIPRDVIAPPNGTAHFDCIYENAAETQWYINKQDTPIANNSRYFIFPNGSLEISPVRVTDEGLYECVASSFSPDDIPRQKYVSHLRIAYIENLTKESLEPLVHDNFTVVVPIHDHYEITCLSPKGFPNPRMWWEDPKGHVINDSGRARVDNMRLIINEVQKSDHGNYTCIAENIAGQTRILLSILIAAPPVIITHPVDVQINEGENVRLQCIYSGSSYPVTTVTWMRDVTYLKDTGKHISMPNRNGTLFIRNAGLYDIGSYSCEINTLGFPPVQSQSASLVVKEKLKFIPAPVNRKLELGSNAKIYCKAGGATPPVVKWIKSENPSFEWPPHIRDDNGTLHFNGVLSTDAGKYMCVATNSQGVINATIDVDVIVMPKFSVHPSDTEAVEGNTAILHCLAEGDPQPTIQWDKNNVLNGFDQSRFTVMENGSLHVSEVHLDDEGKYGCTAGNSGGFRRDEVSLSVKASEDYNLSRTGREDLNAEGESTMTKTVAITLGAAGVYMLLVVGLMIWCRYRRARRKALMLAQATADVAKCEAVENGDVVQSMELRERICPLGVSDKNKNPQIGQEVQPSIKRSTSSLDNLQYSKDRLQTVMLLGHGEYGEVFLAKAPGIIDKGTETVVMVKTLESKNDDLILKFEREITMFHKLKHDNVAALLGICKDTQPMYMLMDYTDWGDLKQFLLATRPEDTRKGLKAPPLSVSQVLSLCHQVALGMEYLSQKKFVHRDLAARNCLVSSNLKVTISSPSLSQDTYSQEYFHYRTKNLPLRWAPAEAVFEDEWSTKSDVWSYGALIWEVFRKAELPFSELSNDDILQKLQVHELKWQAPEETPKRLIELLEKCWSDSPKDRPSFSDVLCTFSDLDITIIA